MNRRSLLLTGAALAMPLFPACSREQAKAPAASTEAPPTSPPSGGKAAYDAAAQGHGFVVGQMLAADTIYVFFDTQCPHCANLWVASKPLLGKLKMMWMPVGLLSRASLANGAAILAAPQPVEAMDRHEALLLAKSPEANTSAAADKDAEAKVQANTEIFRRLGADSVPQLYFRNLRSGAYGAHGGGMSTEQLRQLVGA